MAGVQIRSGRVGKLGQNVFLRFFREIYGLVDIVTVPKLLPFILYLFMVVLFFHFYPPKKGCNLVDFIIYFTPWQRKKVIDC